MFNTHLSILSFPFFVKPAKLNDLNKKKKKIIAINKKKKAHTKKRELCKVIAHLCKREIAIWTSDGDGTGPKTG